MAATTALQNAIRGSIAAVCSFAQSPLIAVVGTAPSVEGVDKIRKKDILRSFEMARRGGTRKIGRSAITGKFMPVKKARKQSRTSVVETIKTGKKK